MALSRNDWTEAALAALGEQGLSAVAVEPLARRLGATKGSFYWHFSDRNDLIAATLALWEEQDTDQVIAEIEAIDDAHARLVTLMRFAYAEATGPDAHFGVLAAASDPRVRPVLERVTEKRLAFVERLYRELGLRGEEAARRAHLAYALYVGIGQLRRTGVEAEFAERELQLRLDLAVGALVPATAASRGLQSARP